MPFVNSVQHIFKFTLVINMTTWKQEWTPDQWTTGKGLWIVGTLLETNFLVVTCTTQVLRFLTCRVKVEHIFERFVNTYGNEVYPDFRNLNAESTLKRVDIDSLDLKYPKGLIPQSTLQETHPNVNGVFEIWGEVDAVKKFQKNDSVAISTTGGFFIKTIQSNNGGTGHFTGDDAGMMTQISSLMTKCATTNNCDEHNPENNEGVAEDEWDDY